MSNNKIKTSVETFGILAEFSSPSTLMKAAEQVRDKGYQYFDVFSPFPVHGMDSAMGLKASKLPWIVFVGGMFGLVFGLVLQWWVATTAYPMVISGKPLFSYQAFVPITFELMVLFAAFGAVFGMLVLNGLPRHYHPLFKITSFLSVTSHGFFLMIECKDKQFNSDQVHGELKSYGGYNIEIVKD
jgi:hypothetical protein